METKRNELEKFNHSVGVLVKAFFTNNLERMSCKKCAVGNLIEAAGGFKLHPSLGIHWPAAIRGCHDLFDKDLAQAEISTTGYTGQQLREIENVFMERGREDNFIGLMAVVDVLADIHGIDLEVKESAKLQFVKA
jgi:hypothetical protein